MHLKFLWEKNYSTPMLKQHHRFFNLVFQVFDLFLVILAWLASYPLRLVYLRPLFPVKKGIPLYDSYAFLSFAIVLLWYIVFVFSGVYKSRRTQSLWPEIITIVRAHTLAFVIMSSVAFLLTGELFSRGIFLVFYFVALGLLFIERLFLRQVLKSLRRRGFNQRNTLIVGDNEISAAFLERLGHHLELGLFVKGVVDLENRPKSYTGLPVLSRHSDLGPILESQDIDQVIIALKNSEKDEMEKVLASLVDQPVDVRIIPDLHQYITLGCDVEEFEGLPLISLNQSPIVGWNRVAKRISDIVYATLALILFAPLMGAIAIAIKILTPGPVIYRQKRMGLDGRVFNMLKFRTMRIDAEKSTGAVWATKDDDRTTWLGKILRRLSLDELPQLINVLKGEMSCVGPRPERPALVEKFKHDIPRYMLRHKVKAGMTGWAQINGLRGNTSLEKRIEYDLYYIANWSLFFDFKIMLMTVFKGFISKNAY